jgi:hypothetical protein
VAAWRGGKSNLLQYFVAEVMRASAGQTDPVLVAGIMAAELSASASQDDSWPILGTVYTCRQPGPGLFMNPAGTFRKDRPPTERVPS